jgi:predicted nucleic acid-binding protein
LPEPSVSVIYWDASAILSVLFRDNHSDVATKWAARRAIHLMSSLAHAETWAVASRMKREGIVVETVIDDARLSLDGGPWRYLNLSPDREIVDPLAMKWSLRGADLWHLAAAKTLQTKLPEIYLLTFDGLLEVAARGEGLIR